MTTLNIPINQGLNRSISASGVRGYNSRIYDAYIDGDGNVVRRPPLHLWANLSIASHGIDGLYFWKVQSKFVAVCNGHIFTLDLGGTPTQVGTSLMVVGKMTYFADNGTELYIANGGQIVRVPSTGSAAALTDGDAPTTVSHVAMIDTYLLALEVGTQKIWYSDVGAPTSWSGVFFSADGQPDNILAFGVKDNIVDIFGENSIEGWTTTGDAAAPFVRNPSYSIKNDIISKYCLAYCTGSNGGTWWWMNQRRQIVYMNGRSVAQYEPEALNKYLNGFSSVTDAEGGECIVDGIPHYILNFSSANKTIAINLVNGKWTEFGAWNSGTSSHDIWLGRVYDNQAGYQYVGDRANGYIHALNSGYTATDNGATINTLIQTGVIDHGSLSDRKFPRRLCVWANRDYGSSASATIKWRDNGSLTWKTSRTINLSPTGDNALAYYINDLGSYITRQYEIAMSSATGFCLTKIDEEF